MHVRLNYLVYAVWPRRHICFLLESADMIPRSWSAWKWSVTQAIEETGRGFAFSPLKYLNNVWTPLHAHDFCLQFVRGLNMRMQTNLFPNHLKKPKWWIQLASGVHQRSRLFRCENFLLLLYWVNTIANQDIIVSGKSCCWLKCKHTLTCWRRGFKQQMGIEFACELCLANQCISR